MRLLSEVARRAALLTLTLGCLCLRSTNADTPHWASEYDLRSAFVLNIISFVDLPQDTLGAKLVIGFAGEGPMASAMARFFADKRVASRTVEVRVVRSARELRACNVLLLAYPDRSRTREALSQLLDTQVLTIGDGEAFTELGGIVALVPHDNTFGLAINPQAAERAHLKISSKLLHIAKLVPSDAAKERD